MTFSLIKENCSHCLKNINLGQKFFECFCCNCIIHEKCFKISKSALINHNYYCIHCKLSIIKRYNPFKVLLDDDDECDDDPMIIKVSQTLEQCKQYSTTQFNTELSEQLTEHGGSIFLNIDGNRSNFDLFSTEYERLEHKFPIIALAETNISPEESPVYFLEGYKSFYQATYQNKPKGTGVALYIHESLNAVINGEASTVTENLESLFVTIHGKSHPIHVGVIYRPPSGNQDQSLTELHEIMNTLPKSNVHIMGDFNINLHNSSSTLVKKLEDIMLGTGFFPLISTPTHEKPNCKPSCIDNIFTNEVENTVTSGVLALGISHHHAVFQINTTLTNQKDHSTKHTQYYDYNSKNVAKFLSSIDDEFKLQAPETFTEFSTKFHEQLDKAFKLDKPKTSKRTPLTNPWITDSLIASSAKKDKLYDGWKKSQKVRCTAEVKCTTQEERRNCSCDTCKMIQVKYCKYKEHRLSLKHLIQKAKHNHTGSKLSECAGDSKKTWEIINKIRGKSRREIKPNFILDDRKITDRRLIANEFNRYFVSLAAKLNENYRQDYASPAGTTANSCSSSIYLTECDQYEIMEIISELKNGKSSDIPIHLIKKSTGIISPLLASYFNKCMQEGLFPDELKTGRITPIYKKDNEELFENYRPISTLPVFGKILEKLIFRRLYNFLSSKGLITENQFGFRKGHSTSHALNYSVAHIESLLREKKHILGIFLDLSKAFDTISHSKLLSKLSNYGIRGNALNLIESYLSNRSQYVDVLNEKSECLPVEWGVPQGSVLGPLLFIIYINDLPNVSNKGKFILFADDTNLFVAADSRKGAYDMANELLTLITEYMKSNLLHINAKKSCYMYFNPNKREMESSVDSELENLSLAIEDSLIVRVKSTKFLGVIIDDKLSWKPHIESLNRKLKSAYGRIYRIKNCLPVKFYKQIYHTLFESHLTFAISVWGGVSHKTIEPLFITQKKCIRMLFGNSEAFKDKFKTCARSRPIQCTVVSKNSHVGNSTKSNVSPCDKCNRNKRKCDVLTRCLRCQVLDGEFYSKESTKPIFSDQELLTVYNLYRLRCITEFFTVMKYRLPIGIYSLFTRSERNDNRIITPKPSHNFVYKSSWLWNKFRDAETGLDFAATSCKSVKSRLNRSLLSAQSDYSTEWHEKNFTEFARAN